MFNELSGPSDDDQGGDPFYSLGQPLNRENDGTGPVRNARPQYRMAPYSSHRFSGPENGPFATSQESTPLRRSLSSQESFEAEMSQPYSLSAPPRRIPLAYGSPNVERYSRMSPQTIDRLVDASKLGDERQSVHDFAKLPADEKLVALYIQARVAQEERKMLFTKLEDVQKSIAAVKLTVTTTYNLSKEAKNMLGDISKHFVIQPNGSYMKIHSAVSKYVAQNCKTLGMKIYSVNEVARKHIDTLIQKKTSDAKSSFSKKVKASIAHNVPLAEFAKKMAQEWHLTPKPTEVRQDFLAAFALLRKIAAPFVGKTSQRGVDSGNWFEVEKALTKLYSENGNKRTSPAWIEWEKKIIAEDEAKYCRTGGPADKAFTWQDIAHLSARTSANADPDDEDEMRGPHADDIDREEGQHNEDGSTEAQGSIELAMLNLAGSIAPVGRD